MEFKKRVDLRRWVILGYLILFAGYLIIGLTPAEATQYDIIGELKIPSIGLESEVAILELENHRLPVPDEIVGSFSQYDNKTLLVGHSSMVFQRLNNVNINDYVFYDGVAYIISDVVELEKSQINMEKLLADTKEKELVIMTCAGEDLGGGDSTHRLIVYAEVISSEDE